MMKQNTHQMVNQNLCGVPIKLKEHYAQLKLLTTEEMIVDDTDLIHGGFIFGLADYCSMLTVNHPNVVLGGAEVHFLKPVKKGDLLIAKGKLNNRYGKEIHVKVDIFREKDLVFDGEFICYTPKKHVLKRDE
jgi:acyl-coenzyme A thioesterase PaaI-like protein